MKKALAVGALTASVFWLSGCEALNNFDRSYAASYDAETGRAGGEVWITKASQPGQGQPRFGAKIMGSARPEPDFKTPVAEMRRFSF